MKIIGKLGNKDIQTILLKTGNMAGLAKHLGKKLGGDPHFFTKCMEDKELSGYDDAAKKGICADAHKLVTGIWPGAHGGANPNANEPAKKQIKWKFVPKKDVHATDKV